MAKNPAPGYSCQYCGYTTPFRVHIGCAGTIMIDTDTGVEYCGKCNNNMTTYSITCRKCNKRIQG